MGKHLINKMEAEPKQKLGKSLKKFTSVFRRKNKKMKVPPLNPMVFYPRFQHIPKQIFEKLDSKSLNPKRAGIFWRSKSRGGVESTHHGFRAPVLSISMQINPNTISNESWHLYLHVESLNTILSCIVLPWGGVEVAYFDHGKFPAFGTMIFENLSFLTHMDTMYIKWKLKTF